MSQFPFEYFDTLSISVVVPVYNEGHNINKNLRLLLDEVSRHFKEYEVIVVSDGSTDQTNSSIQELTNSQLKVIILEKNEGKGSAVRRGFSEAKGEFILFIDGGMELHPREIKIFLGIMLLYDADIVVGSKRHPQSTVFYPLYRRGLSFIFQIFVKMLFQIRVTDTQVGIKMFRRKVINDVLPYLQISSYGFDLEILGFAAKLGYKNVLEAPVRLDYFLRNKRTISYDLGHTARVGFSLLCDLYRIWWRMRALRPRS